MIGGGLIDPATYQSANKKLIGSMMVYEAESIEVIKKIVEEDVYYTGNVVCMICPVTLSGMLILCVVGQGEVGYPALGRSTPNPTHRSSVNTS